MAWNRCRHETALRAKNYRAEYRKNKDAEKSFLKKSVITITTGLKLFLNFFRFLFCLFIESIKLLPIWIYELFRFCPFKAPHIKKPFYIIGHRGAAAYEIENTLDAFDYALNKHGANALEMDLSFTKDKEVVLWHDWDPDDLVAIIRQLGLEPNVKYQPFTPGDGQWRRKIHKLTLEELRSSHGYCLKKKSSKVTTHIPSLAEFFQWSSKQATLEFVIFDIKTPEEQKKLIPDMLSKIKALIQQNQPQFTILLMSPIKEIINEMKKVAADLNFTYDIELPIGIVLEPASYSAVSAAVKYENHYASSGRPTVLQLGPWTTYRRLMQFDLKEKTKYENSDQYIKNLLAWTINRKREMKCLVKMGVDGMVTDRPDRLKKIYDRLNNA